MTLDIIHHEDSRGYGVKTLKSFAKDDIITTFDGHLNLDYHSINEADVLASKYDF